MGATLESSETTTPPGLRDPATLFGAVAATLEAAGIPTDDDPDRHQGYLAACSLLLALGVEPLIDPGDHSRAAETARLILAEDATRTTTRSRRSV